MFRLQHAPPPCRGWRSQRGKRGTRADDFDEEFGKAYREPGYFAKFVAFFVKLVPNVGPLKRLPYKPLPLEARQRFDARARASGRNIAPS